MILTEREKNFIQRHNKILEEIFKRRIDELFDEVLNMPKGEEKDIKLLWLKEYKSWSNSFKVLKENPEKKSQEFV